MINNNKAPSVDKRFTIQMVFLALAMLATMADFAYIHYVCPVCGVITAQQIFISDIPVYLKLHNPAAVVIGVMAFVAVLFGPIFCGWVCPFGAYQDLISKIANKIMPSRKKIRMSPKLDRVLRYFRYVALAFVIYMTAKGSVAVLESGNPYHALLNLVKGEFAVMGLVFLAVITLMAWFIDRPWCKYLCPYGSVLGLSNGIKLFKVVRNQSSCVSCKKCNRACPMNLDVASSKAVTNHQCISCFACTSKKVCPVDKTIGIGVITPGTKGMESLQSNFKVGVASGLIIAMSGAGYAVANMKNVPETATGVDDNSGSDQAKVKTEHESLNRTSTAAAKAVQIQSGKYLDGVYTGQSVGYQPGLKVQVTVKNKKIADVSIVQHNETPGFYERAFRLVPSEIVMSQGTNVDTVSGATYSSKGIIKAVNQALANAVDPNASVVTNSVNQTVGTTSANSTVGQSTSTSSLAKKVTAGSTAPVPTASQSASQLKKKDTQNKKHLPADVKPSAYEKNYREDDQDDDDEDEDGNRVSVMPQDLQVPGGAAVKPPVVEAVAKPPVVATKVVKVTGLYKNGTYYGTGTGYQPDLKVKVTVSGNKVTDIQLVSSNETPRFLNRVWSTVTGAIVQTQKSQVDTVSGATYSSLGIMEAVQKALANAKL